MCLGLGIGRRHPLLLGFVRFVQISNFLVHLTCSSNELLSDNWVIVGKYIFLTSSDVFATNNDSFNNVFLDNIIVICFRNTVLPPSL